MAQLDGARGARIQRYVRIHLGSAAPGCEGVPYDDDRRWREFLGQPEIKVVAALLTRLQCAPADVWVRTDDPPLAGFDVMADLGDVVGPVASIREGLTAERFNALLSELAALNWRPTRPTAA